MSIIPKPIKLSKDEENRFWSKVQRTTLDKCWEWQASLTAKGYGQFYLRCDGRDTMVRSHRVAFALIKGDTEFLVLHHCNNPACCNPAHLYAGTCEDNTKQSVREDRHVNNCGEVHGNNKLSEDDVRTIFSMYKEGYLQREIAEKFEISRAYVSQICSRKAWKYLVGI